MIDPASIRSILVIKLRNIGDVLLTSALFANLKLIFPEAQVSALVNSGTQDMLTGNPDIAKVHVYDRTLKKVPLLKRLQGELGLLASLRNARFDLVINLTEGDRGAIAAFACGSRWRVGVDAMGTGFIGKNRIYTHLLPRVMPGLHAVEQNLQSLKVLGLEPLTRRVSFHFTDADRETVVARLQTAGLEAGAFFQAHLTSRWMFKTMPPVTAARLLDLLIKRSGLPCLITSSPERKELEYLNELQKHLTTADVPVFSDLSLKQLGALSSLACFFAGVDSAPMHMAAALDIPVLGIFGPSKPQVWGPWDNRLDHNPYTLPRGVQRGGKHVVLQSSAACVPCDLDGCNSSKKSDCLDFPLEQLESVVNNFVSGVNSGA